MSEAEKVEQGIAALIGAQCAGAKDIRISGLERIVGGNSSEIWQFDAKWSEAGKDEGGAFILRRGAENEFGSAGRAAEFRLLHQLADFGVPAPRTYWFDGDGSFLARPSMIMERSNGLADRNLLRPENKFGLDEPARRRIVGRLVDTLAAIHNVEVAALDLDDSMACTADPAAERLAFYDAEIARQEAEPMPELRLASLWLHEHLPKQPARLTLVHGDYRPGNMLIENGALSAVLDWEFAHVGDPAEDLGWYLTPYYVSEHFVAGVSSPDDFLTGYSAATGREPDRQAAHFWSVFAMYKLASMTIAALAAAVDDDPSRLAPSARFIIDPLLRSLVEEPEWLQQGASA